MRFGFERVKTGRLSSRFKFRMVASRDSGLSALRLPVIKTALPFFGASIPGFVGLLTGRGPFSPAFALIPGRSIKTTCWFRQASQTTASVASRGKSSEGKVSSEQLSSIQRSRQVSESQIETSVVRNPSTSLSARIHLITIPSPVWSCSLSRLFQEPGVASVEPGLESGGVSPGSPSEDALVLGAHFLLMLLDIAKCRVNLARADEVPRQPRAS